MTASSLKDLPLTQPDRRREREAPAGLLVAQLAPDVPVGDLDVGAHPGALPVGVGLAAVVAGEAVDVAQALVGDDGDYLALQADVGVPVVLGQDGERDARVTLHVLDAGAGGVQAEQDAAVVL